MEESFDLRFAHTSIRIFIMIEVVISILTQYFR